jgi:ATP synthase protein I
VTTLSREAQRLLVAQLSLMLVLAAGFALASGVAAAVAVAFGGGMAIANAWLMARGVARATEIALRQPGAETMALYLVAVQRFVLMAVLFAVGIGVVKLLPVQLIVGFAVVHGAFFLSRGFMAKSQDLQGKVSE